jgi:Fe-S cluster assembly protein SufB
LKQDHLLLGNIQVVYLVGDNSQGEFYSVALTNNYQQADTGTKMIHIGKNSRSRIISKGISAGKSKNSYRGLVNVTNKALEQEIILNVILY